MAIDITSGVYESGKQWLSFAEAGAAAGEQQLLSLDNTTSQRFEIYQIQLGCVTGNVAVMDGSGALPIVRCQGYGDVTIGGNSQIWDWRDDPLMMRDDVTSLCITAVGTFNGFVKFGFASKSNLP